MEEKVSASTLTQHCLRVADATPLVTNKMIPIVWLKWTSVTIPWKGTTLRRRTFVILTASDQSAGVAVVLQGCSFPRRRFAIPRE